jgi:hypothetical protein
MKPLAPVVPTAEQHAAPWWYRLLARLFPTRCREIPEANNPKWPDGSPRIVLRQFAIWKRRWYLQQFACREDPRFMHSHPFAFMIAIGLWGRYVEHRIAGPARERKAPYLYTLDSGHVHHVQSVTAGHTSLFLGFGPGHDGGIRDKRYYGAPTECVPTLEVAGRVVQGEAPRTATRPWREHIKEQVARI